MNQQLTRFDITALNRALIGFDQIFNDVERRYANSAQPNYPPYNIVKLTEDNFLIEIAVAGFSEGEIDINLDNRVLTIKGTKITSANEYLHKGISDRDFVREFTLAEYVEVASAVQKDGILTINLERIIPEEKKPKTIAITYTK